MIEFDIKYRYLPNGVRTLLIHDETRNIVASTVLVKTGSRNDWLPNPATRERSMNGRSHYDEHSQFKRKIRHGKGSEIELYRASDRNGTIHDIYTEKEYTVSSLKAPRTKAEGLITTSYNTLFGGTYPWKEVREEGEAVISEMKEYEDDIDSTLEEEFQTLLYEGSDMARPILGDADSIRSMHPNDLKKYHDYWYRGENVLVVLAGNVRGLTNFLRRSFDRVPSGPSPEKRGTSAYGYRRTKIISRDTDNAYFLLGVPGVQSSDSRFYTVQVLKAILGGHSVFNEMREGGVTIPSSKLYEELRVRKSLLYDVAAVSESGTDIGYIGVRASASLQNFAPALRKIDKIMFSLPDSVNYLDLVRAKEMLMSVYIEALEKTERLALMVGGSALMEDRIIQPKQIIDSVQRVSLKDVKKVASEIFLPSEKRLLVVGPFSENSRRIKTLI
jgi:predicted Zn-dependent peptidase